MSRELPNELEERRFIRLLTGAADAVPPLHEVEVETFVRVAVTRPRVEGARRRSFLRRPQLLGAAAVAAVAVLAVVLPTSSEESERHRALPSTGLVAFPEGSALSLLLSRPGHGRV